MLNGGATFATSRPPHRGVSDCRPRSPSRSPAADTDRLAFLTDKNAKQVSEGGFWYYRLYRPGPYVYLDFRKNQPQMDAIAAR